MDEEIGKLIEPSRISFGFDRPGWYVLGALCFMLTCLIIIMWVKQRKKNAYRRLALRLLEKQENQTGQNTSWLELIYDTNNLMKRIAVRKYGRENVADKTGNDWIALLNSSAKSNVFDETDAVLLSQDLYGAKEMDYASRANLFMSKAKVWIQKHKNAF